MELRYPKYFRVKATTVTSYAYGLTSIDIKKYQQEPKVALDAAPYVARQLS
jgi:hypothetical protein